MRPSARCAVAATAVLAVASIVRARPRMAHWGATGEELTCSLPGDDVVPHPDVTTTRGITVAAPPDRVFAWLAQIGQGRGGFYSYDWLENRMGLGIHSADRILPQYQRLARGDRIPVAPGPPFYGFTVVDVRPPARLVLQMRIHPFTGLSIQQEAGRGTWSLHATWAFSLAPLGTASTRLTTRSRTALRMPLGLKQAYGAVLQVVEFVMERRMLLGLRARAERGPGPTGV